MSNTKDAGNVSSDMQKMSFEEAVRKLESIVESMEAQDLPLEALLKKYEEGTRLAAVCQSMLNAAELKIQKLEKNSKGDLSLKAGCGMRDAGCGTNSNEE